MCVAKSRERDPKQKLAPDIAKYFAKWWCDILSPQGN